MNYIYNWRVNTQGEIEIRTDCGKLVVQTGRLLYGRYFEERQLTDFEVWVLSLATNMEQLCWLAQWLLRRRGF